MARALTHLLKYFVGLDPAQTQTTQAERDCIVKHARRRKRVVEIGVFEGVTTGTIASVLDADATLFAIDPFIPGRVGICWGKPIARSQVFRQHPKCKIHFVESYSFDACKKIDGSFDFIFIDGDHSWDGIVRDWSDWSERVDVGGVIGLHDTSVPTHNPRVAELGSYQYFQQHIQSDPRFKLIEQVDSLNMLVRL